MEIVQLDTMGPLPTSESGNKYILVVTCLLTKYPECIALKDKSARTVASAFMDSFLCRYMCPKIISTDAGTEFTAALTTELMQLLGIAHRLSTSFLHSSVGQVERLNKTLISALKHCMNESQDDWDCHIGKVLMAYRASTHSTTLETPHFLLYGWDPASFTDRFLEAEDNVHAESISFAAYHAQKLCLTWKIAKNHIEQAQQKMKTQHNIASNHQLR